MKKVELEKKVDGLQDAYTSVLFLLADIRAAVGDAEGRLMQDELVARCRELREGEEVVKSLKAAAERMASAIVGEDGMRESVDAYAATLPKDRAEELREAFERRHPATG